MENELKTCQNCSLSLPEGYRGFLIPGRKVKGEITYKRVCKECFEINWIVREREYQKKKGKVKK